MRCSPDPLENLIERTERAEQLCQWIREDPWRLNVLQALEQGAPEGWVAAGFIRNLVWDILSGQSVRPLEDVDILIHDPTDLSWALEEAQESNLRCLLPEVPWSVRNQARMHQRNKDAPYGDIPEAMSCWLETATGVAVRSKGDRIEIMAAYGLGDLFDQVLRPTQSGFKKLDQLEARVEQKGWLTRWPGLAFKKDEPAPVWQTTKCEYFSG